VSRLRENFTSGSDGEGLETGHMVPRQSFTRQAGFKEIKQEMGSSKSQTRNADAVLNHLNFCMMATTLTWIYADRLQTAPDRKYKIRGRTGFAFSDVRRIIAEAALDQDFQSICSLPVQTQQKSFVKTLLRMVA
jgi:hypothetical protein